MQLSVINPESFKDGFNLSLFLSGIAKDVLEPKTAPGQKPDTSTAAAAARVSLDKSRSLSELLVKAEGEALYAHGEVAKSVATLQASLVTDQSKYKKALSSCERHSDRLREVFRRLEERSNRVGQVSTRLGDRLQRADAQRSRALELVKLLEYLALFAALPEYDGAFAEALPGLFWEDRKMADAAAIARKLRDLTSEAESARERNRLAGAAAARATSGGGEMGPDDAARSPGGTAGGAPAPPGSLDYCTRRLGQYCLWLENRVVARFDQAVEDDNLRIMGECARIMAAFDREKAIIQRYISLLAVFQSSVDDITWVREPAVGADDAVVSERLRPLSRLYSTLAEMVAVEAGRMASVFPSVRTALQMLAVKVFEDRVHMALERLLEDTAEDAFSRSTSFSSGRPLDEQYGSDADAADRYRDDEYTDEDALGYDSEADGQDGTDEDSGDFSDNDDDDKEEEKEEEKEDGDDDGSSSGAGRSRARPRRRHLPAPKRMAEAGAAAKRPPRPRPQPPAAAAPAPSRSRLPPAAMAAAGSRVPKGLLSITTRSVPPSFLSIRQRLSRRRSGRLGGAPKRPSSSSASGVGGPAGGGAGAREDDGSSGGPSVLALHLYLRLLAAAYVRTGELAEQVESAASGQVDVTPLVDSVFEQFTKLYPAPELQWLDMMAEKELGPDLDSGDPAARPELTLPTCEALMRRNAEAVQRCLLLCPPAQLAAAVRLLYVGEAPYDGTMPGSLMEHLPKYLIDGVEREMELTLQLDSRGGPAACNMYRLPYQPPAPPGSKGPPPPLQMPPPVTRAAAAQAAQAYVTQRVVPVLRAVHRCTQAVTLLQQHHAKVILPGLAGSAPEVSACANGLAMALRAVEAAVLSVMQALVDMVVIQAEKVLMYEQRRAEFLPPSGQLDAALIDRPTDACLLVCALFEGLAKTSREALEGSNLSSFRLDIGCRMHATFLNHMQQFIYNAAGALRWRNDVAAYSEVLRGWGLPAVDSRMAGVGSLVGILVVEPDQLLPLINGTLRLEHREALKYVRLRQDFPVARVQGRSLLQLFGSEDSVPGQQKGQRAGLQGGAAGASGGRK